METKESFDYAEAAKKFTKRVFLKLKTQDGEREYYHFSIHLVTEDTNLNEWAENYTKDFWCREGEKVEGTDWYDFGEMWTQWLACKEITKEEYDILSRFI